MCTVFQIIYVINKLYIQSGCLQLIIRDISFIKIKLATIGRLLNVWALSDSAVLCVYNNAEEIH